MKIQFDENQETALEGDFENGVLIKGTYTSTFAEHGAAGTFELTKQ